MEEEIIEPLQDPVAERCADTLDACLEMRGGVRLTLEHASRLKTPSGAMKLSATPESQGAAEVASSRDRSP